MHNPAFRYRAADLPIARSLQVEILGFDHNRDHVQVWADALADSQSAAEGVHTRLRRGVGHKHDVPGGAVYEPTPVK